MDTADPSGSFAPVHTTSELLARNRDERPDDVFVAFIDEQWTNAEVDRLARSVASALISLGVEPGDRVAAWLPNGKEALLALFGANVAGAALAPLNTAYRGRLLEHALNLVGASILIVHASLVERLATLRVPALTTLIVVGTCDHLPPGLTSIPWDTLLDSAPRPHSQLPSPDAHDDMLILMTSGTTGPSKAVRCSYAHHAAFGEWYQVDGRGHEHRYLIVMPMFHVGGSGIVFGALNSRGSIAMLPRFSTSSFWADVRALGATVATLADSMAAFLLQSEARPDDDRQPLRLVFMTGLFSRPFAQRFGVETFCGFAMTEAPGPLRAYPLTEGTSCGRPWGGWHARIVDAHDAEVPVGTAGELIIRHETPGVIASGYVDDPEADREAWRDGWFHTGDQMVCDAAGNYYFKDRRKDTLRRRGENISSFEVEAGVLAHHQVLEAAVVAVPAAEGEDDVMAFVVLKEGASLTAVDLIEFLVDQLPHYMVPRYLEFVSELPKTPTEKIKKAELRARGIGPQTWDRERAGLRVKSTRF